MTPPYEITTSRLSLYALSLDEIPALMRNERADLSARIGATIPPEWPGHDLTTSMPLIAQEMAGEPRDARWVWVVIEQASAQVIGDVGFHGALRDGEAAEIGYVLLPHARGRGYGTEATAAVIDWTFTHTNVVQIIAQIDPDNDASLRVAAKLGMRELPPTLPQYKCFGIARPQA